MAGSVPLERLGARLRELRELKGLQPSAVAALIGRSKPSITNWELGNKKISHANLLAFLSALQVSTQEQEQILALWSTIDSSVGSWSEYKLPRPLAALVKYEETAESMFEFCPVVIPGLLQTEDYTRAMHLAGRHKLARKDIEKWVAARIGRQQKLFTEEPLRFTAIIAEAALRLVVGSPAVLVAQLERLFEVGERENITIHVVPAETGYIGTASNFAVLTFPEDVSQPKGFCDDTFGGEMVNDPAKVAKLVKMAGDLKKLALDETASRGFIQKIIHEQRQRHISDD